MQGRMKFRVADLDCVDASERMPFAQRKPG
jgi:hypothetical protein